MPAAGYVARANDGNFLVVQIEEPAAVPHIDSIAALPGVDVLFVGPGDLSLSLGKLGQSDDPEMLAIIQEVAEACRRNGKTAGIPCTADQVPKYHAMGYGLFNVVSDYRCMLAGLLQAQAGLTAAEHLLPATSRPPANGTPITLAGARPDPAAGGAATTGRAAC